MAWPRVSTSPRGSRAGISPLPNLLPAPIHPPALVGSEMQFSGSARQPDDAGKKKEKGKADF